MIRNFTEEWNNACLRDEDAIRNDPNRAEKDAARKKAWEDAVRAKHAEKLRTDPKFAEEWYKTHPEDRPKE